MPSAANLLHEKRGLGKAVDPPLRVREDWWVFEDPLRLRKHWWVFEDLLRFKEALVVFRKTSLALREVFRKPHSKPYFLKNKAYFLIVSKKYQNLIRNPT